MTKINLSTKQPTVRSDLKPEPDVFPDKAFEFPEERVSQDQQLLLQTAPGKLLYSIRDTAIVLGLSYEFVRSKIYSGQVLAQSFGTRKLVHVTEISRLISEGLPA